MHNMILQGTAIKTDFQFREDCKMPSRFTVSCNRFPFCRF